MMMSYFSSFDPSVTKWLSLNWGVVFLVFFSMPMYYWSVTGGLGCFFKMIFKGLIGEWLMIKMIEGGYLFVISLFYFIFFSNLIGLFPYVFTSTTHLVVTFPMAFSMWLGFIMFGWLNFTSSMMGHMLPLGTPFLLMFFMVLVETLSQVIRPVTLSVRLSANMIAGHLLLALMGGVFEGIGVGPSIVVYMTQFILLVLEMAVAIIQSYVFVTLFSLYMVESN